MVQTLAMNAKALARRLDAIERHEALAFAAFLAGLSEHESRTWFDGTLERLADAGIIAPAPTNLWTLPQAEKAAFLDMLRERLPGDEGTRAAIRHAWQAWRKQQRV